MTTKIEVTKTTEVNIQQVKPQTTTKRMYIEANPPVELLPDTIIIQGKPHIKFTCAHCGTVFSTVNWTKTRGRHHSATCPSCYYSAWAR